MSRTRGPFCQREPWGLTGALHMKTKSVAITLIAALAAALGVGGCASDYQTFYQANPNMSLFEPPSQIVQPTVRVSTGDHDRDVEAMYIEGYGAVGYVTFNGPARNIQEALVQAKKVGATFVVVSHQYTNTVSGAVPLTMPTSQTSYINGTVRTYGSGGYASGNYSGTATTYGSQTTFIPYSVSRFDQQAIFFGPLKRTGLGILSRSLTATEAQALGSEKGIFTRAVRHGSPAYQADLLPGDVVREINGNVADDPNAVRQLLHLDARNHIVLTRNGKTLEKDVVVPSVW